MSTCMFSQMMFQLICSRCSESSIYTIHYKHKAEFVSNHTSKYIPVLMGPQLDSPTYDRELVKARLF